MVTFNFTGYGYSAIYSNLTGEITINLSPIMNCNTLTDDEKIELINWQIEHEIIHSVLHKYHTAKISHQFENIAFAIRTKNEFNRIINNFRKVGYKYHGRKR